MDDSGSPLYNEGFPYYKHRQSDVYMWWMWHGAVGHWVVNDSPGMHGDDRLTSAFGGFGCPQACVKTSNFHAVGRDLSILLDF